MKFASIRRGLRACRLAVVLALGLSAALPASAETVRIGGTGAALGTMERLAEDFAKWQPGFAFEIVPNLGSGGGLRALARGAIQIAVVSRPLKPEEHTPDLSVIDYGRTPFVVVTAKPGVKNLSHAQLAQIFSGHPPRWPDGSPARPVLRPASDIDADLLAAFSPEMKTALEAARTREGMVIASTDRESADAIERLPGAIGTSSLALILSENRRLTPLSIDGATPTVKALADGTYRHAKTMTMVVRRNASPMTARFRDFVASGPGRRILVETGHLVPAAGR